LITPPDIASMLIMLVPMYGLYELGILLLRFAPAKAVAEGSLLRFRFGGGRKADNRRGTASQSSHPAQTEEPARRPQPLDQAHLLRVDEKENGS
jgi:hypothetical protein